MLKLDKDSLICDFAETYNIYDYKRLPLTMVASLALGLRDNSRIKMLMSGQKVNTEILLMASIVDRLSVLVWQNTEDARKNRNKPKSILEMLESSDKESETISFTSGEDFTKYRQSLLNGGE